MCLTIKDNQRTLRRQVACQFEGKRHIPFVATDHEKRHGRTTIWTLRAKEAPHHIKDNWPGSAWIVEVIADTTTRKGKRELRQHLFITNIEKPKNLIYVLSCSARAWRTIGAGPATSSPARMPIVTLT